LIGTGFLRSLADEVGFRLSPASLQAGVELVEFDELGLRFSLDGSGRIELAGGLGPDLPPDTVIARGDSTIAAAPQSAVGVRSLARALVPTEDEELVPAVAESRLLRHLPLPRSVKAQGSATTRANSPTTP
jgi:hypothetical protein